MSATRTVHRTCTICEATCGIEVTVAGRTIRRVRGDTLDPFSQGRVCPKVVGMKAVQEDPDRLRRPLIRRGGAFVEADWDEAFQFAAVGIRRVRDTHGADAVAFYRGNPVIHDAGTLLGANVLSATLGTRQCYSAGALDTWPRFTQCAEMYGGPVHIPVPDLDRTSYLLMLGANPLVSQGSIMTAPGIKARLQQLRKRGGRIVVVDPRRSETAAAADEHLPIVPGADSAFLLAVMQVLFTDGLVGLGACEGSVSGLEEVRRIALAFPPERCAPVCGIPAATIRRIAREFAAAPGAVAYGRMGTSVQPFGTLACWAIDLLCILTGNFDRPGGIMFAAPAASLGFAFDRPGGMTFGRWHSRVSAREEMFGELPIAVLAEEITTPGEERVRALVTVAGNPVNTAPNSGSLERAVGNLEFMVAMDYYVNETTRHADVILPPTGPLERSHYDLLLMHVAVRNVAKWSPAALAPEAGAPDGWTGALELARRLAGDPPVPFEAFEDAVVQRLVHGALAASPWRERLDLTDLLEAGRRHSGVERIIDALLRIGPYGDAAGRAADGLNLERVKASPHGIDLGPLAPGLPGAIATPDHRIRLAPPRIVDDVSRLEGWMAGVAGGPLRLINRRDARSMNSWLHNAAPLAKGPDRCTLQMHPDDAARRGLGHGDLARLESRTGTVEAPVEITDAMMPGVVSLPHGFGHRGDDLRLHIATRRAGVNVNHLSDHTLFDQPSGASALFGIEVEVSAVE